MWADSRLGRWALACWTGPLLIAAGPAAGQPAVEPAPDFLEFLGAWGAEDEEWIDALVVAAGEETEEEAGDGGERDPEEVIEHEDD